ACYAGMARGFPIVGMRSTLVDSTSHVLSVSRNALKLRSWTQKVETKGKSAMWFDVGCGRFIALALLLLACGSISWGQVEGTNLHRDQSASRSGLTGAGTGDRSTTAAKPGEADGLGNPILGGERHPLYRLRSSDVVEVSFTVAP